MPINVGRIDRAMVPGSATPSAHDPAAEAAFGAAMGQGAAHKPNPAPAAEAPPAFLPPPPPSGPLGAQWPAELPFVQGPAPQVIPRWVPPSTIKTVRDALTALAGIDRAASRRLLAKYCGTLDAGQLGFVLDITPEIAADLVVLLDEVGDGRLGEDELDPGSLAAALERLDQQG